MTSTTKLAMASASAMVVGALGYFAGAHHSFSGRSSGTNDVHREWVKAARDCWTGMSALHDYEIEAGLQDETVFRSTFIGYRSLSNTEIDHLRAQPLKSAAKPDALDTEGVHRNTVEKSGSLDNSAPTFLPPNFFDPKKTVGQYSDDDVFCSVKEGLPSGFNHR